MFTLDQTVAALGVPVSRVVLDDWSGGKLVVARWRARDVHVKTSAADALRIAMSLGVEHNVRYAQPGFVADIASVPGDIRIYPPTASFETAIKGESDVLHILIDVGTLGRLAGRSGDEPLLNIVNEDLRASALALFMAERSGDETRPHQSAAMLRATVLRLLVGRAMNSGKRLQGGLQPAVLRRVDGMIDARLDAPHGSHPSLGDLAGEARLSVAHFIRAFRRTVGTTPHQYVMARRRQRAMALLRLPQLSVGEIADRVGFSSPAHFVAAFRQRFGVTPGDYRLAVMDPGFTGRGSAG